MGGHAQSVAHVKAAVESRLSLRARPGAAAGRHSAGVGRHHRGHQLLLDLGHVIEHRRSWFFIGQDLTSGGASSYSPGRPRHRWPAECEWEALISMAGLDPAFSWIACRARPRSCADPGVDADQRHAGFAVVEDGCPHLAGVVKAS